MDTYDFIAHKIGDFCFHTHRYFEYEGGMLKSTGLTNIKISVNNMPYTGFYVSLFSNNIKHKILSSFEFDACVGCYDRVLLYSMPVATNADIPVITALKSTVLPYTRGYKFYHATEPVVCSIFTNNSALVKISFTLANPERLIEFFDE